LVNAIILMQKNKEQIIHLLAKAFENNLSVNFTIFPGKKKHEQIKGLVGYSYEIAKVKGEILFNSDTSAATIYTYSHKRIGALKQLSLDLQLIFKVIGLKRLNKVMKRNNRLKSFHPETPYLYLWFIGVDPDGHQKGEGTKLLKQIMEKAEVLGLSIYLETSMKENLPFYKKYDFEVYHEENVTESDYKTYFIRKLPKPRSFA
jgi:ribosomal protein S18 acetylase RimI-like enzyme